MVFKGFTVYKVFRFVGVSVALSFKDLAGEYDVFEVENSEVIVFKFISSMVRNNVVTGSNEFAELGDRNHVFSLLLSPLTPNRTLRCTPNAARMRAS